jgi:hypothetical protein
MFDFGGSRSAAFDTQLGHKPQQRLWLLIFIHTLEKKPFETPKCPYIYCWAFACVGNSIAFTLGGVQGLGDTNEGFFQGFTTSLLLQEVVLQAYPKITYIIKNTFTSPVFLKKKKKVLHIELLSLAERTLSGGENAYNFIIEHQYWA